MSRDDFQQIRERLFQLTESYSSGQHLPFNNVKRKGGLSRQTSKAGSTSKLSVQDFVRMDPGYTPDIEHLVFPNSRRKSSQQVAPTVTDHHAAAASTSASKPRSRLAEMFALSRHLQKSANERGGGDAKSNKVQINKSVDSAIDPISSSSKTRRQSSMINDSSKKWIYSVDGALHQNNSSTSNKTVSRQNSTATAGGAENRGSSNISILHLKTPSEPWEKDRLSSGRNYFASSRSVSNSGAKPASSSSLGPVLTKHQSLCGNNNNSSSNRSVYKWSTSPSFHSGSEVNSPGIFTFSGSYRELSPVRWCDREVDGVYLGKSGWVQVQQRSLEENRKSSSYSVNLAKSIESRRTGVKLANYHCYSEPHKCNDYYSRNNSFESQHSSEINHHQQRPTALHLDEKRFENKLFKSPPPLSSSVDNNEDEEEEDEEDGSSPPSSVTPIISPPLAFQDKTKSPAKTRMFFGKTPFLPRSKAFEDSDNSPPVSPIIGGGGGGGNKWITTAPNAPLLISKSKTVIKTSPGIEKPPRMTKNNNNNKVPQAKSLEDSTTTTSASRRNQFKHQYGSSSSSSSSTMGFRSLDSCLNRTGNNVMPRLLENDHGGVGGDVCEDADEEDNNSSSANMNITNSNILQMEFNRKLSPSGRSNNNNNNNNNQRSTHYRNQQRRSPAGSDTKPSPASSSSSSNEFFPSSPTPQHPTVIRKPAALFRSQQKATDEDSLSKVRRSRSLQLPERQPPTSFQKLSPQHALIKSAAERPPYPLPSSSSPSTSSQHHSASLERSNNLHEEEELLREAEVVTGFLYGNRSRAAAQALLMHRYNNNNLSMEEKNKEMNKPSLKNDLTVYYVGNNRNERQRVLLRGATSPSLASGKNISFDNNSIKDNFEGPCTPESCNLWPHCVHRDNLNREPHYPLMRSSQTYPTHQRSSDSLNTTDSGRSNSTVIEKKKSNQHHQQQQQQQQFKNKQQQQHHSSDMEKRFRKAATAQEFRRISPTATTTNRSPGMGSSLRRNESSEIPIIIDRKTSPRTIITNISGSSSGSEAWINSSKIPSSSSNRNSRTSTPEKEKAIFSRPGSAPMQEEVSPCNLISQQRSMSLPKSFLTTFNGGVYSPSSQITWRRHGGGTDSVSSSPGFVRKPLRSENVHTAPVTPLHEGRRGGRSPLGSVERHRAISTPHLAEFYPSDSRNWKERSAENSDDSLNRSLSENSHADLTCSVSNNESVLQRFRKTISSRFNQNNYKSSKESCISDDTASETFPSEEESSPRHNTGDGSAAERENKVRNNNSTTKHRFVPLVWRSNNKERKRLNKTARNSKCNSGDSGIQIEIPNSGTCGGGGTGESSESHDAESPPVLRRNKPIIRLQPRPYSDIIKKHNENNEVDSKQQQQQNPHHQQQKQHTTTTTTTTGQVRRTRSDLGGQRLLGWEQRQAARKILRNMATSSSSTSTSSSSLKNNRPLSPRKRPSSAEENNAEDHHHHHHQVVLRRHHIPAGTPPQRPALRRSLSQPIDIDKISSPINLVVGISLRNNDVDVDEQIIGAGKSAVVVMNQNNNNNTSDEDNLSDSDVSSIASLKGHHQKKSSLELPEPDEDVVVLAEAVFDHVAIEADELPFRAGDVIEIEDTADREWWWGSNNGRWGWFPAQFVRLRVSQEDTVEDCLAAIASGRSVSNQIRRRTSISLLSNDQVRTSVVRELVNTERDFVKILRDVSEGYLIECRKRKDMFNDEQIATIFINLEDILQFQLGFLRDLETCINWDAPHKSLIGDCFLKHSSGFKIYSDYCNSHPIATAALQDLNQFNNYTKFFEACRLMRGLIEIPLDGYLLTPVQRICKYPLQLAELLKYTRTDHEDYSKIKEALEVMRGVAMLINERKRIMESLEKLYAWQQRVDGWEGEDLIENSSQLIRQGEVVKVTTGVWSNNITLFLFDHQVVYCKKDILKRNAYVYKGKICLDNTEVINVPDGKDPNLNINVRHGIKLLDSNKKDKFFIFCCRSAKEKLRWLEAFQEERKLIVEEQDDDGLRLSPAARNLAKLAAYRQKRPPRKFRQTNKLKTQSGYLGSSSMLHLNAPSSNNTHSILGRKMATWFNFKKTRHRNVS